MKLNNIQLLLSIIVICSCTDILDYNVSSEKLLQMDALIDSADSVHTVHLCWSTGNGAIALDNHDSIWVSMYVNNQKVSESLASDDIRNGTVLKGRFYEGDIIRLVARSVNVCVEAETVAPKTACIPNVDTLCVGPVRYFNITVNDIKGEDNYYRISIWKDWQAYVAEVYYDFESVYPGYFWGRWQQEVKLSGDEDPLLSSQLEVTSELPQYTCDMKLFNDELFRNGQCRIKLKTEDQFIPSVYQWSSSFKVISEMTVIVRLHSMNPDTYRYLDDVLFDYSDYSLLVPFPTIYPSNVKGGLGFVGAVTSSDYVMKFPTYCYLAGRRIDPTIVRENCGTPAVVEE